MGALAYLLKNRFYIGEVVYRGDVHRGGHEPILDRALFEAVERRLAAQALERRCRLHGSPALLSGRLFEDRGHRMSPSHTNKGGARYRYYVSQAVLQKKPQAAGSVGRVPAAEIEALIMTALRNHLHANSAEPSILEHDRELLERNVERVTLTPKHIKLQLRQIVDAPAYTDRHDDLGDAASGHLRAAVNTISIPWTSPVPPAVKGIIHVPTYNTPMKPSRRDALLIAIAKARQWLDDLANGRVASISAIARREGKVERHVRLLVPLAFVSPRTVSSLLDGTAPASLTITTLARALPYSWAEQERRLGLHLD